MKLRMIHLLLFERLLREKKLVCFALWYAMGRDGFVLH